MDFDLLVYVFGFWMFVFNKRFRALWIGEFKESGCLGKFYSLVEAVSAVFFGVALPALLIAYVLGLS